MGHCSVRQAGGRTLNIVVLSLSTNFKNTHSHVPKPQWHPHLGLHPHSDPPGWSKLPQAHLRTEVAAQVQDLLCLCADPAQGSEVPVDGKRCPETLDMGRSRGGKDGTHERCRQGLTGQARGLTVLACSHPPVNMRLATRKRVRAQSLSGRRSPANSGDLALERPGTSVSSINKTVDMQGMLLEKQESRQQATQSAHSSARRRCGQQPLLVCLTVHPPTRCSQAGNNDVCQQPLIAKQRPHVALILVQIQHTHLLAAP